MRAEQVGDAVDGFLDGMTRGGMPYAFLLTGIRVFVHTRFFLCVENATACLGMFCSALPHARDSQFARFFTAPNGACVSYLFLAKAGSTE